MNKDIKFLAGQLAYAAIALFLMLFPFFTAKWNMSAHYIYSFLSFSVLLRNVLFTKRKTLPIALLIIGTVLIFAFLQQAKTNKEDNELRINELYRNLQQ